MPTKQLKRKLSLKLKAIAVAATCSALIVPTYSSAMGQCCGETEMLNLIYQTMQQNFKELYTYLLTGEGDAGTGFTGTTSANAQSKASHGETAEGNLKAAKAARDRERAAEKIVTEAVSSVIGNPMDCSEASQKADFGLRGVASDAASASAAASSKFQKSIYESRTAPSEASSAGEILNSMSKYCSEADAKANRCTKGTIPDGNVRAESLFKPATDFTDQTKVAKQSSTFDANGGSEQMDAATESLKNILGRFSPPSLPKGVANSPAGKMFTAKFKVYEARLSPAENILTNIAGRRAPTNSPSSTWEEESSEYTQIYQNVARPAKPSEEEAMKFEIMRRYAGANWQNKLKSNGDLTSVLRERALNTSVELKVLYDIHTRLEEQSAVRAAILSQLVSPVNKGNVNDASSLAYRAKQ